jgi:hypothetical protein
VTPLLLNGLWRSFFDLNRSGYVLCSSLALIARFQRFRKLHQRTSMSQTKKLCLLVFTFCGGICYPSNGARTQGNDANLPDSPSQVSRSSKHGNDPPSDREVSWRTLPTDFLHDQRAIWLFPTQLAKGHYWLPTIAIAGGTAGLIVADPHVMPYFRSHAGRLDNINDVFDAPITTAAVVALPASS